MGEKDGSLGPTPKELDFLPSQHQSWISRIITTFVTLIVAALIIYQFRNHFPVPPGCTGKPKY
ncbi:hypothetical protein BDZ45DRAFT_678095 [Acephala macrosclerotiorum]|nr:hypothetical protein BDZ45DRAFT_678095 [Acephala macrosclerotiorum]